MDKIIIIKKNGNSSIYFSNIELPNDYFDIRQDIERIIAKEGDGVFEIYDIFIHHDLGEVKENYKRLPCHWIEECKTKKLCSL